MRSTRRPGLAKLPSRRAMLVPAIIASIMLAACGGGGGGGGSTVVPLPTTVFVDDAPIIGVLVQDNLGQAASASAAGEYRFDSAPTLPLKISSRNIVGANGRVSVTQVDGLWYSYADTNNNGRWDSPEQREPLTFQDLDGNGLYTQSVDIVFNGSFLVNYAKPGATVIQANVVASLLPRTWNGATPVAGVSAAALNAAVTVGPTKSANAGSGTTPAVSAELRRATAVLTAISEGLVSTLRTSTTNTTAQTQTTINNALSAIANSSVNLAATDATSIGQVASAVSGSVPQAATQANNLVSNVMSIASGATSNFEAVVKVTQVNVSQMVTSATTATLAGLTESVTEAADSIKAAKEQAQVGQDPDNARIANLRLQLPYAQTTLNPDTGAISTGQFQLLTSSGVNGFSLQRQQDGSILFAAKGSSFASVLGTSASLTVPFEASKGRWEYIAGNLSLKIAVNVVGPNGEKGVSALYYCTSSTTCFTYFAASPAQICATTPSADDLAQINLINLTGAGRGPVACN